MRQPLIPLPAHQGLRIDAHLHSRINAAKPQLQPPPAEPHSQAVAQNLTVHWRGSDKAHGNRHSPECNATMRAAAGHQGASGVLASIVRVWRLVTRLGEVGDPKLASASARKSWIIAPMAALQHRTPPGSSRRCTSSRCAPGAGRGALRSCRPSIGCRPGCDQSLATLARAARAGLGLWPRALREAGHLIGRFSGMPRHRSLLRLSASADWRSVREYSQVVNVGEAAGTGRTCRMPGRRRL